MSNDSTLWRPRVREIVPYEPGKPIDEVVREFGVTDVVKLASNENPLGPSPRAMEALQRAISDIHIYPDAAGYHLREALAKRLDVPPEWILLGNGSAEIIEIVTEAFLGPDDEAVTGDQAFFKYRIAVQIMDGQLTSLAMPDMSYDVDAILGRIQDGAKIIFLANPNNPTGTTMATADVDRVVNALGPDQLLVLDEAYYEYIEPHAGGPRYPRSVDYIRDGRNVVILRTFSKAYGLAGLRIGYAIGHPDVLGAMWRVKEAFNANALAQVAALAALQDTEHLERSRELNESGKEDLYEFLTAHGIRHWRSDANFVLIDVERPAAPVFDALLRQGVIVRPLAGYRLPTCLRVSVGTPAEMDRFKRALPEVLAG